MRRSKGKGLAGKVKVAAQVDEHGDIDANANAAAACAHSEHTS